MISENYPIGKEKQRALFYISEEHPLLSKVSTFRHTSRDYCYTKDYFIE